MSKLPNVKLTFSFHHGKEVCQIHFEQNEELAQLLRSVTVMRWSRSMNCWYALYTKTFVQDCIQE